MVKPGDEAETKAPEAEAPAELKVKEVEAVKEGAGTTEASSSEPEPKAPDASEKKEVVKDEEVKKDDKNGAEAATPSAAAAAAATPTKEEVKKMRAVVLNSFGGMKGVKCLERPQPPAPKEGQVTIQVKLSALNFQDLMIRLGFVDSQPPKTPFILGTELVGVVTALGPVPEGGEPSPFKVGQLVFALPEFGGAWAEFTNVETRLVWPAPEGLALESLASSFPYLVAYLLLARAGNLGAGSVIAVHSAGGGVGTALRELAGLRQISVVGIAGEKKHEGLNALGGYAHLVKRVNGNDYVTEIKKLYPNGVDAVFDCQGGDDCARGLSLLAPSGTYVLYGSANIVTGETRGLLAFAKGWWGQVEKVQPMKLFEENKALAGLHVRHLIRDARDKVTSALDNIWSLMAAGKLSPVIDQRYHFEQIVPAMQRLHERKNIGKVLILPELPPVEEAKEVEACASKEAKEKDNAKDKDNGSGDNGSEAEK